jgi:hypothetical protein
MSTWSVSPCLAVYLKHPADFYALVELDDADKGPDGATDDDWTKFREVAARAREAIGQIVIRARDAGVEALKPSHERQPGATLAKTAAKEWYAEVEMKRRGKAKEPDAFLIGCSLFHNPDEQTFVLPWVQPVRGGSSKELLQQLKATHPRAEVLDWFAGFDHYKAPPVVLARVPLSVGSDLNAVVATCGDTFRLLAGGKAQ